MRSVRSYVKMEPGSEERTEQLVALLASGLERFLSNGGSGTSSGNEPVDFPPNLSVTTDGQSEGL